MTEQQARYTVPARTATTEPKRRTPLPDTGEAGTTRLPSSARRYPQPVTDMPMCVVVHDLRTHKQLPTRAQATRPAAPSERPRKRTHALTLIGSGMLLMALLYFLCSGTLAWWQGKQDDWTYGNPRTAHFDARVGHGDETIPSHFIAMNLSRQVRVIEFPGNDASKAKVYIGPILQGKDQEHAPVTLSFRDVNLDQKPDMLILVKGIAVSVFINDTINNVAQFRPATPEEVIHV